MLTVSSNASSVIAARDPDDARRTCGSKWADASAAV